MRQRHSRFQPECHGPVINEADLHVGPKFAGLDRIVLATAVSHQVVEVGGACAGLRRFGKARSRTLASVGGQRELRYEQQAG